MQRILTGFVLMALLAACGSLATEVAPTHVASLVPPDAVASSATGSARARLAGVSLIIEGDYKNLGSTVTSVRLEQRDGGSLYSLQASGGATGTFGRTQDLTADEITALNNGQLEVAVYTTNYPEGTEGELRGPLTPR